MGSFLNTTGSNAGTAQSSAGISLVAFLTAAATSLVVFGIQTGFFLLLRNKLARIYKPKTYLAPERERTEPPPYSPWGLISGLLRFKDREIINKCGLDSYFFLRYLQTLLVIFIPMAVIIIPILVPINYSGGLSQDFSANATSKTTGSTTNITGLDTLAWGNVAPKNYRRYWAHLILAVAVVIWVCYVLFAELRVYIKVRQDWLTTAEHRLRASATTVLVSTIPDKWLSEDALRGLFDVFPGGIRNIWLTRDLTELLDKINKRDEVAKQLEAAETELIRMAKKKQMKKQEADEKKQRKASKMKGPTKEQVAQRRLDEDAAAKKRAESGGGQSSGDQHETRHSVLEGQDDSSDTQQEKEGSRSSDEEDRFRSVPVIGTGLSKITQGLGKGVGIVEKTGRGVGRGIVGGAKTVVGQVDNQLETSNGFVPGEPPAAPSSRPASREGERRRVRLPDDEDLPRPSMQSADNTRAIRHTQTNSSSTGRLISHSANGSVASQDSIAKKDHYEMQPMGNTTRKAGNPEDMFNNEETHWYEFWKPPSGGYASPIPQGTEDNEFPFPEKPLWQRFKAALPFIGGEDVEPIEYPEAFRDVNDEEADEDAEWKKWIKKSDRPTHRLAKFDWTPSWLPGLPLLNKKVDTIYWCRKELARLNLEIEMDQASPERFPLMKSAFIQFNHQVAAHMACQSVIHHLPRSMAPRMLEMSPNDIIWDNMAIGWLSHWIRNGAVIAIVLGMIILWAIPVAFTSSLSQITSLINTYPWLKFLETNSVVYAAVKALAGIVPALLLSILLSLVPVIMGFLASFSGAKTGSEKSEFVQTFYFIFLFVQVFLVVSLSSSIFTTIEYLTNDPTGIANILAENLPKAADYFFSYMILQALSTSSGTLLQIGALISWYVIAKIFNKTARDKWTTNTSLPNVTWGSYFPVYTDFACIALIYSVIAPIISIFAIITFSLLWVANRYTMLYVNRFTIDTGGVLYPRAINQTFTGVYVMEICLIGLFFLVTDQNGNGAAHAQAIIMIVVTVCTVIYQILLNRSFGPLFRYLPITFEDEAVLRDEAFQRAQDRRLGLVDDEENEYDDDKEGLPTHHASSSVTSANGRGSRAKNKITNFAPVKGLNHAGQWAVRRGKTIKHQTYGRAEDSYKQASKYRNERRKKDLEAQRAIGEALYGGINDEIEDLTPEERDVLVRRAFIHSALRARRPTVWIPRDDIGISDDEIRRTRELSEHIWISNEGTALDHKVRVVYGRAPPDFSEVDLINM